MNQLEKKNRIIELYVLLAVDLITIYVSYLIAYFLRFSSLLTLKTEETHRTVLLCLILSCMVYSFFLDWNRNFIKRGYFVEIVAITKYNCIVLMVTAVLLFLLRQIDFFSRLVFIYFAIGNEILTFLTHFLTKKMLRKYYKSNHSRVRVMVVSEWEGLENVIWNLKKVLPVNYEITALCVTDHDLSGSRQYDIPVVAGRENLMEIARQLPFDEVFMNLPHEERKTVRGLIKDFESMGAVCHYNIEIADWNEKESSVGQFGNYTVITYTINHMDYRRLMIKRLMDIIGGFVGLCFTAVLTPFVAFAIKLDSKGPVFFSQIRIGKNGRRFKIYKFRSMYIDAEARKKELQKENEMQGLMFKIKEDPRITRVGRFIRKTSIDELPQFYNILIGDMSLVGTRPPTEDEFEHYSLYYRRRLCMTPGLTGLWQVNGRSKVENFDDVVKYDLEYIDNWTIGLDIKILLQTVGVVFTGKGSE